MSSIELKVYNMNLSVWCFTFLRNSSVLADFQMYILCRGVFVLVTSILLSIRIMSWSLIQRSGLHSFTRLGCVVNTSSMILSRRVGKSTVCSIDISCIVSMKYLFILFGLIVLMIDILQVSNNYEKNGQLSDSKTRKMLI